jgi:hypothetical protein
MTIIARGCPPQPSRTIVRWSPMLIVCIGLVATAACRPKETSKDVSQEPSGASDPAGNDSPVQQPDETPSTPPAAPNAAETPPPPSVKLRLADDLAPPQLVSFLREADRELRATQLEPQRFTSLQEQKDAQRAIVRMKLQAADRLLAHVDVTAEQRQAGNRARLQALSGLSHFRDLQALQELEKMAKELADDPDLRLATDAANVGLGLKLERLQAGELSSSREVLEQLERLVHHPEVLELADLYNCQQALALLTRYGYTAEAQQARTAVLRAFGNNSHPLVQQEIELLKSSARFDELNELLRAALAGEQSDTPPDFAPTVTKLVTEYADEQTINFVANAALGLESNGQQDLALQLLQATASAFAGTTAERLTNDAKQLVSDAERRFRLEGQTFEPQGSYTNGATIDWSVFRGRPTVVVFWSPRRPNAVVALGQLEDALPRWGRGKVQVLGIVLDAPGTELGNFLAEANLPWDNLFNRDPGTPGWREPNADAAGVGGLPFFLLLDGDGKVVAKSYEVATLSPTVEQLLHATSGSASG